MPRSYTQTRRASAVDDTRRRIVEAAVRLHGTVGPARTSISAIAAQAGVQRLTVYRHFADDAALFAACTSHWLAAHPPPDASAWAGRHGARAVASALTALYDYYEATARMWRLVYRDAAVTPAMQAPFEQWQGYLAEVRDDLLAALGTRGRQRTLARAALTHALAFPAWDDLVTQGLTSRTVARVMATFVEAATRKH